MTPEPEPQPAPDPEPEVEIVVEVDGDADGVPEASDCDDTNATRFYWHELFFDGDGDGYTTGAAFTECSGNTPPDGFAFVASSEGDCDDDSGSVWRKAMIYIDADGDGVTTSAGSEACIGGDAPEGFGLIESEPQDCDDDAPLAFAAAVLYPDPDNDGHASGVGLLSCIGATTPEGYTTVKSKDCAPLDPDAFNVAYVDADGDGFGAMQPEGEEPWQLCVGATLPENAAADATDCDDADAQRFALVQAFSDEDGDGFFGTAAAAVCSDAMGTLPGGLSATNDDCDDTRALVHPTAREIADDGFDNDCSGGELLAADGPGVYVAPGKGCDDAGEGDLKTPACTIGGGIAIAQITGATSVFVKGGDFNEELEVSGGLSLFGGYDAGWLPNGRTTLTVPSASVELGDCGLAGVYAGAFAKNANGVIAHFDFVGPSSIANESLATLVITEAVWMYDVGVSLPVAETSYGVATCDGAKLWMVQSEIKGSPFVEAGGSVYGLYSQSNAFVVDSSVEVNDTSQKTASLRVAVFQLSAKLRVFNSLINVFPSAADQSVGLRVKGGDIDVVHSIVVGGGAINVSAVAIDMGSPPNAIRVLNSIVSAYDLLADPLAKLPETAELYAVKSSNAFGPAAQLHNDILFAEGGGVTGALALLEASSQAPDVFVDLAALESCDTCGSVKANLSAWPSFSAGFVTGQSSPAIDAAFDIARNDPAYPFVTRDRFGVERGGAPDIGVGELVP